MRPLSLLLLMVGCAKAPAPSTPADVPDETASTETDSPGDVDPAEMHGQVPSDPIAAPDFTATAHDGTPRTREHLIGHPTVMWFYPKAATSGWTLEGCGYRDLHDQFQALGVTVVGVSFDTPEDNAAFAEGEGFQYELWSDTDRTLALAYGAATSADQAYASRITVVLDAEGRLALVYPEVNVSTHPADVLEDVQKLFGE